MSVTEVQITVMLMLCVPTLMGVLFADVLLVILEMESFAMVIISNYHPLQLLVTACPPQVSTSVPLVLTTVIPTLYVPILLEASLVDAGQAMLEMVSQLALVRLYYKIKNFSLLSYLLLFYTINSSVA